MTTADLAFIETAQGVTLPAAYRAAMLAYPLNPADLNSQIALQDDARAVVAFNRYLRSEFPGDWKPGYFAVGNSPNGDPYFLDFNAGSSAMWLWDHETHEVRQAAPDLVSWVAMPVSYTHLTLPTILRV